MSYAPNLRPPTSPSSLRYSEKEAPPELPPPASPPCRKPAGRRSPFSLSVASQSKTPHRAWTLEPPASPAFACSRRIRLKTSSALCGRADSMDARLLSRTRAEEYLPTLVRIPAGWFLMGCDIGQDNEKPVHRVWVDEYLLAACQVTNAEYSHFLRDSKILPPPFWSDLAFNHPEQPVAGVSWQEAARYCEWLGATTGRQFRLPTEAEWERAARGGREKALFPWGDEPPQSLPGYADRCAGHWKAGPEPVGCAEPNAYGLYNMCDNVHEWCSDWYAPGYYAVSP